jgi:uncharacterized protein (DUF1501 family)
MRPTRRDFIRLGLGTASLLACGTSVPAFLAQSARGLAAGSPDKSKGRLLVTVQLDGGNDGLNTIVPYRDDEYRKRRPKLQVPSASVLKIDDRVAFHPALRDFAKLLERQQLAAVQSVGYPNPNRSHFTSMAIWQSARLNPVTDTPGWLARYLDNRPPATGGDAPALHLYDASLPQALTGSTGYVPSFESLEFFRRRLGLPGMAGREEQKTALDQITRQRHGSSGSLLQFVERTALDTYASSARLEGILNQSVTESQYPEQFGLARRLRLIAQLVKAGLATSIYYTQFGGFDTHANQWYNHVSLLRELGASLKAFLEDLEKAGAGDRVLVLIFSEFGRRLAENASGGTDHGTAAPVFLLGQSVRSGLHGPYPNLIDLQAGDPKHAIDFRQIYATILDQWLGAASEKVLGEAFVPLSILAASTPIR